MTNKPIILTLSLLLAASLLSSCLGIRETEDRSDETSVEMTVETTAEIVDPTRESNEGTTTVAATETTEVTETTQTTKATENIEATQTVPPEVLTEAVLFEDWELQMGYLNSRYLKNDESAWVFDENVRDGLLAGDVFVRTEIPVGTVVLVLNDIIPEPEVFPGKKLFLMTDGRCVFFEQSTTEDREPVYNGKTEDDFFGASDWDTGIDPVDVRAVRDYELLPNTPLDPSIRPQNITVKVDWNGDGKVDTIRREIADASAGWPQVIRYTDGATGKTTDVTERIDGNFLSDNVMLISGGSDESPALIDSYDTNSHDFSIFIYTFDPDTIIACEEIDDAAFVYDDGALFIDTLSFLFGNISGHRTPVAFDGKTLTTDPDVPEIWWKEALLAKKNGAENSKYFTYTLTEVPVEKKISGGFEESVVPAGVAIFPQYFYWDEDDVGGTGYVHFLLTDGTECRLAFEFDTEYDSYWFGNDPQWELFYTPWGG
ncbi:MAG: hypothetical protein PHF65_07730 [Oscillospiraceae bacterium]|nr:hypothetical protein [Oscillospiraceae bacterium]